MTTLADADIPEVNMASGDGIVALENLKHKLANAGLGNQQLECKFEVDIVLPYDTSKSTYFIYIAAFLKIAIEMEQLYPTQYNNSCLSVSTTQESSKYQKFNFISI